jgi:hypothetical protein
MIYVSEVTHMALRVVERKVVRREAFVSLSGKFARLLLFQAAYDMMKQKFGKEFSHIQFLVDDQQPEQFWMRPVRDGSPGAAPIRFTGPNRVLSVAPLLQELSWTQADTVRMPVKWDGKHKAWAVECGVLSLEATEPEDGE